MFRTDAFADGGLRRQGVGFGGRDKGLEAFDQYTEKKTVWISVKA